MIHSSGSNLYFNAIYQPKSLIINSRAFDGWHEYPIDGILAMLSLGHKYQFDKFECIARKRMLQIFPVTFIEWERSTLFYAYSELRNNAEVKDLEYRAYDILALMQKTGLRSSLPVAYLFCLWNSGDLVSITTCCTFQRGSRGC